MTPERRHRDFLFRQDNAIGSATRVRLRRNGEGCGHCTATCTLNARVHEEVRAYGMVVDPGCMKCADCVSVCPMNALYFGLGKPAAGIGGPASKVHAYSWGGEGLLAVLFLVNLLVYREHYGRIPFLLAPGLAAILREPRTFLSGPRPHGGGRRPIRKPLFPCTRAFSCTTGSHSCTSPLAARSARSSSPLGTSTTWSSGSLPTSRAACANRHRRPSGMRSRAAICLRKRPRATGTNR